MKRLMTVLIILNLLLSFNTFHVFAQTTGTSGAGCCLVDNNGQYCRTTPSNVNCNDFISGLGCDKRSECNVGCCIGKDSCSTASEYACRQPGRVFRTGSCNAVSECKVGGCIIGKQCLFTSSFDCTEKSKQFGVEQVDFRSSMTESECNRYTVSNLEGVIGCCVTDSGCRTSRQDQCNGDFKNRQSCGSISECLPANCKEGEKFFLVERDPTSKINLPDQEITISRFMLGNENMRFHGDSWCVVATIPGTTIGSSHYVYTCVNGRVISQQCSVFRETICQQSSTYVDGKTSINAKCVTNEDKKNYPIGGYFYPESERKQPFIPGNVDPYLECNKCTSGGVKGWFDRCTENICRELGDCTYKPPSIGRRFWNGVKTGVAFAAATYGIPKAVKAGKFIVEVVGKLIPGKSLPPVVETVLV